MEAKEESNLPITAGPGPATQVWDPLPISVNDALSEEVSPVTAQSFPAHFHARRCEASKTLAHNPRTGTAPSCQLGRRSSPYLQTPEQRPPGGTSLTLCPCLGGASGQGLRTWTYRIRTRRRTRTHLKETKPESVSSQLGAPAHCQGAEGTSCKRSPVPPKGETMLSYPKETQLENQGFAKMSRPTDSLRSASKDWGAGRLEPSLGTDGSLTEVSSGAGFSGGPHPSLTTRTSPALFGVTSRLRILLYRVFSVISL